MSNRNFADAQPTEEQLKAERNRQNLIYGRDPEDDNQIRKVAFRPAYEAALDRYSRDGYTMEQLPLGAASGRKASIFVVDCRKEMFEECLPEDEEVLDSVRRTPFFVACEAVWKMMNAIALGGSQNHFVQVLFINTQDESSRDESTNEEKYQYMTNVVPLKLIEAADVQALRKLIKHTEDGSDVMKSTDDQIQEVSALCKGIDGTCNLGEVMFHLLHSLVYGANAKLQRNRCAVHFFSHKSDITRGDERMLHSAVNISKDILKNGHRFQYYLFGAPGEQIATEWSSLDPYISIDQIDDAMEQLSLESRFITKESGRRVISTLKFHITMDMAITVGVYGVYMKHKKDTGILLNAETNEEIRKKTVYKYMEPKDTAEPSTSGPKQVDGEFGTEADENEKFYQQQQTVRRQKLIAEANITLNDKDVKEFQRLSEPGIVLIGFKPMDQLKDVLYIKGSKYIYPLNENTQGSSKVYTSMLKECITQNKFILVRFTLKQGCPTRFAALVPHGSVEDNPDMFEGFHVLELPYQDDKRSLNYDKKENILDLNIPRNLTDKAVALVKKLMSSYSPTTYSNPSIERQFHHIEANALESSIREQSLLNHIGAYFELPETSERAREEAADFSNTCFPIKEKGSVPEAVAKRVGGATEPAHSPPKRNKRDFANAEEFVEHVKMLHADNQLGRMTKDVLFKGLDLVGGKYAKSMKKEELIKVAVQMAGIQD